MQMFKYVAVFILFFLFCLDKTSAQSNITISTVLTNPVCNGAASGAITVSASGGSGTYQYELNESSAGGWQSSGTFTGLVAGTYPVSVRDNNNNYNTVYVTLTNPTAVSATVTSTSASCSNTNDATLTIKASGGAGSYNYAWSYGGTAVSSTDTRFKNYNTSTITGPSGTYTVSVTDKNSCSGAVTYYNASTIPLSSSSFNQDVIVERSASSASIKSAANPTNYNVTSKLDNDATGYVFFESGYPSNGSNTDGLPQNNTITSSQDNSLTYALQSYSTNNSSRTISGGTSTLQLATPAAYGKLLILGTSGSGSSTYSYSVNFSDGTSYVGTLNNNVINYRDWYAATGSDISLKGLNRVLIGGSKQTGNNFAIFEAPITLPPSSFSKIINSVTLLNTSSSTGSAGNIFALSGFKANPTSAIVGYAEGAITQPSVTISSSLDSSTNYYCNGQSITFTAATVHGGANPTYVLEQSINGGSYSPVSSGTTNNTYTYTPASSTTSFSIRVTATASTDANCLTNKTSNVTIFSTTLNTVTPTVVATGPTNTTFCQGTNANYFVTNTTNAGTSPTYTWYDGTTNIGSGTSINVNNLTSGTHSIQVKMNSSIGCASNNPASSNTVNTVVTASPTPTIAISNQNSTIPITYIISSSSNLGTSPQYQWYLNNSPISGATSTSYTTSTTTSTGDIYSLRATSSATCANPSIVMSNYRTVATALPIVLKSFVATAYSNNITLNWQTAAEINTDRFEILRKYQDSSAFVTVGTVKATNNASGSSYQFIDYPKFAGNYQYRLKNYDFDGNFQLSDIQSIYFGNNNGTQTNRIFPNPFTDHITINYNSLKSFQGGLVLYNMNGAVVNSKIVSIISGNQNLEISNLSKLPSGMYILKLIDQYNKSIESFKIIKK